MELNSFVYPLIAIPHSVYIRVHSVKSDLQQFLVVLSIEAKRILPSCIAGSGLR